MIAVDTNVILRLAMLDDQAQVERGRKLLAQDEIWVAKTVLLETEWVLRTAYRLSAPAILDILRSLASLAQVRLEDPVAVNNALQMYAAGLEFTDAIHLASASQCDQFASFAKNFQRNARRHRVLPAVVEP